MSRRSAPTTSVPAAASPAPAASSVRWGGWALLIAGLVLVVFWPALAGEFLWDDAGHVTRPDLRTLAGLWRIWSEIGATQQYYPVLHSAFWLEHRIWGDATVGYHLINLGWHASAAVLFGLVLRRLAVPGAWFAAAWFAVHPVTVESVAWISEQKNTLSLVLYLSAALAYLRFEDTRRPGAYALALGIYVLALLTKTVTASLPAALLVIAWWRHGRLEWRRDWAPLLPWIALGAGGGLVTAWFEHEMIGAQGTDFALGPIERVMLAGRVAWFYLGKLLWPHPLIFVYPRWDVDAAAGWQYLFPIAAAAVLAGLLWLALRRGRRAPLAAALLFGGTLFPVLGFVNVFPFLYSYVADHFQYHASLALFAAGAAGLTLATARWSRTAARLAAGGLLLVLGVLTWRQAGMYRDIFSLFETTLARNPSAWMAHNNLAIALVDAGRPAEALPHYEAALRLRPNSAEGENNLGYALLRLRRTEEAGEHFRRAIALRADYRQARANLAEALAVGGRSEEGLVVLRETLRLYPKDGDSHFNLGLGLARAGRTAEALAHFQDAARIEPANSRYVLHVGMALASERRLDEALPHFRRALVLDPDSAMTHYTVGRALLDAQRFAEAVAELETAVRIDDGFAPAHADLARGLRMLGRTAEAQVHAERARGLREGGRE